MKLRGLTHREKLLVAAAASLLVLGGLTASTLLPVLSRLWALKAEVTKGEQLVSRLRDLEGQEAALDDRLQELREAVTREGRDVTVPFGPSDVLMLLQASQDTWGLSWEQLTFSAGDKGLFTVRVSGTGGYGPVSEFLQALRWFPHTASISLASLRPAGAAVRFDLEIGFQLSPVVPVTGPTAPRPTVRLQVPPLPPPSEGRENPFAPGR
ncbi:MAG: hypothetical protein AB1503_07040 [Bacillota bacterium]